MGKCRWGQFGFHHYPWNNDACKYIQLRKIDLEEMIDIATHTPDYFDSFDSVPKLCEILYHFDEDAKNGWHYYFEFDY